MFWFVSAVLAPAAARPANRPRPDVPPPSFGFAGESSSSLDCSFFFAGSEVTTAADAFCELFG